MIICPWSEISRYEAVIPGLKEAIAFVSELDHDIPGTYPLSCGRVMLQKGTTHGMENAKAEAHREFLDIQLVLNGSEYCGWANTGDLTLVGDFNTETDCGLYVGETIPFEITAGMCYVLFPEDAHKPCTHLKNPTQYTKLVIKLKL